MSAVTEDFALIYTEFAVILLAEKDIFGAVISALALPEVPQTSLSVLLALTLMEE